jgi:hypothetical protein
MVGLVREGLVKDVKALFVLNNPGVVPGSTLELLINFHLAERGFSCRTISSELYEEICSDISIQTEFLDFGLYGPGLMFRTVTYEPTAGFFSRDRDQIAAFHELFDACWTSPGASQYSRKRSGTAQQLLTRLIASSGSGKARVTTAGLLTDGSRP